jgi:hypothetical protein
VGQRHVAARFAFQVPDPHAVAVALLDDTFPLCNESGALEQA